MPDPVTGEVRIHDLRRWWCLLDIDPERKIIQLSIVDKGDGLLVDLRRNYLTNLGFGRSISRVSDPDLLEALLRQGGVPMLVNPRGERRGQGMAEIIQPSRCSGCRLYVLTGGAQGVVENSRISVCPILSHGKGTLISWKMGLT